MLKFQFFFLLASSVVSLPFPQGLASFYTWPDHPVPIKYGPRFIQPPPAVASKLEPQVTSTDVPEGKIGPIRQVIQSDSTAGPVTELAAPPALRSELHAVNTTAVRDDTSSNGTSTNSGTSSGSGSGDPLNPENILSTGIAFLGAVMGRNGCTLKAACYAASLLPPLKGKEMMIMAAEPLVPDEWRSVYQAAKSSVIQKQDCTTFKCF